ncbi:MAG: response regulator [Salibacteraceae bacterium]|jgi:CheY-like chemotaxis protein|nr:response regulator [Salibacteraceae bacterium]MDP4687701.1 response regulator [Salibacteraceae bacterium]MDP4762505.1 response regulator [Salibacteraceae bacterium]MDP4844014.1 response regulator [Salibacteraceae bacterium]MDP4933431.1 response regulator [Salibacteraceae bacterium]
MKWDECAIVDDNKFDRLICERIISRISADLAITEFRSGKEILDYLLSDSFVTSNILILLDINMPEMNGYDFLNEMIKPENSEIASKITVAIITSSTRKEDYDQTIQYPMVKGYLQKLIMIEHLKGIIE